MKSAVFYGKRDIRVSEWETPKLNPDEVLIKVMACGVCGSDLHIFEGDQGSTTTVPPLIQGHEFAGIITEIGSKVSNYKVGDRVCADPADNCGECFYCVSGMMSHCDHMGAIGTNINGGFSEYCKVKSRLLHRLEDDTTYIEGAMAEPLACCINGIDRSDIKAGDNVVIYGGGTIGLLMLQLAKLRGASRVALVEPVKERRETAIKLGADVVINPMECSVKEALADHKLNHIRVVIECCGLKSTSEEAIQIVDKQGIVVLFAVTALDASIDLATYQIFQKEVTVTGSFCSPYTMARAVELINAHRLDLMPMIGATLPMEELSDVLGNAERRAKGKVIILPNGQE
ncbi:L-iditol 2-dehydrogenase [Aequitasia blattaphilus]|uniref:Zinc-dependent alcohol dehydrogenase family protein n=1 Tax=Aequitasia blattaphilus TaxID=2949332 RepID=A0ABT1E8G6_9FIRM|nr:zinc-dependent alcohol dehydrogenase family protein [Aequitasia blattaphilus]MCP1102113.1 zinc-dependent alcohol dehydrogenase family protein [Aequitasia blattaphilus]MCR8614753.1 zinc-dependent alcohol dehydrogenase family protein [Aequitasia blattaphilus]